MTVSIPWIRTRGQWMVIGYMSASWYDHPRDLLHMINHFRKEMPRPLVGIGHSMGGNNV